MDQLIDFVDPTLPGGAYAPHAVTHRLGEHELLTVEAVAQLADRLPEPSVEQNRGDVDKIVADGKAPKLAGTPAEIARGIETNGAWMVLKNIEQDPAYAALLHELLDDAAARIPGAKGDTRHREGFIFLSAPDSVTPSHIDPEHNFLLQIRGTKSMNVGEFPDSDTEQRELEDTYGRGGHRNIEILPHNEREFALQPGQGVYVPPNAPHWVQNGPTVSVSLSITWRTDATDQAQNVHYLNKDLRRLGLSPAGPGDATRDKVKSVAARVAGKLERGLRRSA